MSGSDTTQTSPFSIFIAYQLRSLVLDYLSHHCYTNTAHAFLRDTAVKHFNADGDEVELPLSSVVDTAVHSKVFREADLRDEIKTYILSGLIDDAIELLNERFPAVLSSTKAQRGEDRTTGQQGLESYVGKNSKQNTFCMTRKDYVAPHSVDPAHLSLNLRIQAFIEMCRTVPLPYKPPHGKHENLSTEMPHTSHQQDVRASGKAVRDDMVLLSKAQKLYALVNMLPNSSDHKRYHQELKDVAGLLAYKMPEASSSSKFMSQQRREAVAEQIDSAILNASGRPVISTLELVARHVTAVWAYAHELGVVTQPGALVPPTQYPRGKSGDESETVPPFDLGLFLEDKH